MPSLMERCEMVIAGLDAGEDVRTDLDNLRQDLETSGVGTISVIRDVDTTTVDLSRTASSGLRKRVIDGEPVG